MSRRETIVYVCDWCKDEAPARYPNGPNRDDEMPDEWKEIDFSTMCVPCQVARKAAIEDARHRRLNKASPGQSADSGTSGEST